MGLAAYGKDSFGLEEWLSKALLELWRRNHYQTWEADKGEQKDYGQVSSSPGSFEKVRGGPLFPFFLWNCFCPSPLHDPSLFIDAGDHWHIPFQ